MFHPKWFDTSYDPKIGDVVLFLKSSKEFDKQYQFGIISGTKTSRDGKIRQIEVKYQNHNENVTRTTERGVQHIVVVHPIGELDIIHELNSIAPQH